MTDELEDTDVDLTNMRFAADLLLRDPFTYEELRPVEQPYDTENGYVVVVESEDGSRKWKHTILTEEV